MEYILVFLVPLIIALVVCSIFKSQMKTTGKQHAAKVYINEDGLDLTEQYDEFTHITETSRLVKDD